MADVINYKENLENDCAETDVQLTDEEIQKQYLNYLDEIKESSEELKMVANFPSNNGVETVIPEKEEVFAEKVIVNRDLRTGSMVPIGKAEEFKASKSNVDIEDVLSGKIPDNITDSELQNSDAEAIINEYHIAESDALELIKVAKRYQRKEKFNVYNALPTSVQNMVKKGLMDNHMLNNDMIKVAAEAFVSGIISDVTLDKYQVEFEQEMNKVFQEDLPEVTGILIDSILNHKGSLLEAAQKLRDQDKVEQAETLEQIADACEEAYTYKLFKDALNNHSIKIKKIEVEQYNKIFRDFDFKYSNSPYKITSVSMIPMVLNRILPVNSGISTEDIIKFTVAFCKYCVNYKPSNPVHHSFMYYFINSIIASEINTDSEKYNDFKYMILNNIKDCINIMKEKYTNI